LDVERDALSANAAVNPANSITTAIVAAVRLDCSDIVVTLFMVLPNKSTKINIHAKHVLWKSNTEYVLWGCVTKKPRLGGAFDDRADCFGRDGYLAMRSLTVSL
jgi:hypothetical protein